MLLYTFYNADLVDIAKGNSELSTGFVDDIAFVVVSESLNKNREILKDMMERTGGAFNWELGHNSPFKLSKLAVMDFPRTPRDTASAPLTLTKTTQAGATSTQIIQNVSSYRYLGLHFNPKLRWSAHTNKALASATYWTNKIWRLSKPSGGASARCMKQLHNTVLVPRWTYAAEIWLIPPHKPHLGERLCGSVGTLKKFASIQRRAGKYITGGLSTCAGDVIDVEAFILPVDSLIRKQLFRSAIRISSLPKSHPLHDIARRTAKRFVRRHRSPLHHLFYLAQIDPDKIETIQPARRRPGYKTSFGVRICNTKAKALIQADTTHREAPISIYSDGSSFERSIGAAAVLYEEGRVKKTLKFHLGSDKEHTVYEAESVSITMGLHLLTSLNRKLPGFIPIGVDSQAAIKALQNQKPHPGHYLQDHIHDAAEKLQAKQDGLYNREERLEARRRGEAWKGRRRGVINLGG